MEELPKKPRSTEEASVCPAVARRAKEEGCSRQRSEQHLGNGLLPRPSLFDKAVALVENNGQLAFRIFVCERQIQRF